MILYIYFYINNFLFFTIIQTSIRAYKLQKIENNKLKIVYLIQYLIYIFKNYDLSIKEISFIVINFKILVLINIY